jgi:hypothetical protein
MEVTVIENKRVKKEIKEWDIASSVPAWIFCSVTCQKCLWGINEDNPGDIITESVVVAQHQGKDYVFHDTCFKDEKVRRWVR